MEHHNHSVPTIHFNSGPNAKIYVNTIINTSDWSTRTLADDPSKQNAVVDPRHTQCLTFDPRQGGSLKIYLESNEEASSSSALSSRSDNPTISVDFQPLPEGTSKIKPVKAYVITVHTNNVSGIGAPTAPVSAETLLHEMIKADNVVLNSPGGINVGPGAGASNQGQFSGSSNSWPKEK